MSSTFGSLNIAKSGLMYQQIAIDTADNNISNVNTDGYVRRRAVGAEVGGPDQPVMWSSYNGVGQGVTTQGVQRLSDVLLDNRVRKEHANLASLQVQQTSLERVESSIDEPSDNGVSAALSSFGAAWQNVVSNPDTPASRQSVISAGQTLAAAINTQARALDDEMAEQRTGALQDLADINRDAQQLAQLNHSIYLAQANGSDVGDLQDQRDQVALDLANKAGAVTKVQPDGQYDVTIGGLTLVTGGKAGALVQTGIDATTGEADPAYAEPATDNPSYTKLSVYLVSPGVDPATVTDPTTLQQVVPDGDLGGVSTLLNSTLSDYRGQLNHLTNDLVGVVNAQHRAGYAQDGTDNHDFFAVDVTDPARSIAVDPALAADPSLVAASAGGADNDGSNADAISQALDGVATSAVTTPISIGDEYHTMVSTLGATAAGLNTQTTNQQLLTTQVDDQREQTAGVSLDEETINLMQAQRAYEASSRVLNVMNSILDTLINRTGV